VLRLFAAAVRTGCIKQDNDIALNFQRKEIVRKRFRHDAGPRSCRDICPVNSTIAILELPADRCRGFPDAEGV
jgi:hypothetical protein